MSRVAWVRPVPWCARHDIPWASHPELGVSTDGCGKVDGWVEDWERTKKVGEPDDGSHQGDEPIACPRCGGLGGVWGDELVEVVMEASPLDIVDARAVLDALEEWMKAT